MTKQEFMALTKDSWKGLLVALLVGILGWQIKEQLVAAKMTTLANFADPLLVALIIGIVLRAILGLRRSLVSGFLLAPIVFVPIGVVAYGIADLNFRIFQKASFGQIGLIAVIIAVYFSVVIFLGKKMGLSDKTTYLTATGSAVCGASAISITSQAVEAEPDDVSSSLLSVFVAGLIGLFILIPLFKLSGNMLGQFSGMIMQFNGFVKAATATAAKDVATLATSLKAIRYFALLIAFPLFASMVKKRFYLPWYLWAYLFGGLAATYITIGNGSLAQYLAANKYMGYNFSSYANLLLSIAMAAIGLNTNVQAVFSKTGAKNIVVAFSGMLAAIIIFFIGIKII